MRATHITIKRAVKRRPRKIKPSASFDAHQCVVLAVDTAERSGWSIYRNGDLDAWGEVEMLARGLLVNSICALAVGLGERPVVLVYERPFRGTTQGQYIGAWKQAFVTAGGRKAAMVGVYPATWRARVTGLSRAGRELARAGEMRRALRETRGKPCGADAAAAICVGLWAIRAGEVGAKLPKPRKRKAAV